MAFNYNPEEAPESFEDVKPGSYRYKIDQINEGTFKTGSSGWKVKLLVSALPDRDITVFENIVNTPKCLFKMEQLCNSLGYDFNNPPQGGWAVEQFEGKSGVASFVKKENGYLAVEKFEPARADDLRF